MKTRRGRIPIIVAILACGACADESGDEPEGHMLEAQQQALERARGVERDVAEAARRQAEQIDESENDG
ncbi:MAG: hypothetical protein KGY48_08795 [Wenzhouxiangellaceae bacterium]|jgi:hypothetical protein|nr:hypothetical protein [Wenzhouxiangellaceae bacterium]MBS3745978.1 hypothetical protein [Wenzhouxiangellaceae bacterium]MBS3822340.1 hypothetical protein [Wenzhouxiangellaceae bacterium]